VTVGRAGAEGFDLVFVRWWNGGSEGGRVGVSVGEVGDSTAELFFCSFWRELRIIKHEEERMFYLNLCVLSEVSGLEFREYILGILLIC
jgi:hypothetical protein